MQLTPRPQLTLAAPSRKRITNIVEGVVGPLAIVLYGAYSYQDFYQLMTGAVPSSSPAWEWVLTVLFVLCAVMASEAMVAPHTKDEQEVLPAEQEDVRDAVLDRWDDTCSKYGIDFNDPRTDIWNFPIELGLILELDRVYLLNKRGSKQRKQLKHRMQAIMDEVLSALAVELAYLTSSRRQVSEMVKAADADLLASLTRIRTEQAEAATAAYTEHLLART